MVLLLNVEIISKEMVKPSSPTPHHLRYHKLSFLDQISPPVYIPLIFFYQNKNHEYSFRSLQLKQSLSNTLTQFYPLAGRIGQDLFTIDCNDAGAEFIEARVHDTGIAQLIQHPELDQLKQLLPVEPLGGQTHDTQINAILSVKLTSFDCGGIAVGVCLSHKIGDGTSLVSFMKAWAAMSNMCHSEANDHQENIIIPLQPNFDLAVQYFPPIDFSGSGFTPSVGVTKEKITTKRLIFDKEKVAKLKQLAARDDGEVKINPTRVEAVSAFIWRHFIEAANKAKTDEENIKSSFVAVHAVSLRPRTNPAIPEHAFGNFWRAAFAFLSKMEDSDHEDLITKLRVAIRGIDEGYIKKVQYGEEYLSHLNKLVRDLFKRETEVCNFSSWCRFPMYEVDFGWGKPVWVCTTTLPFKNLVILISTPSGDGIEAWINVPDHDLGVLQTHYNLLSE